MTESRQGEDQPSNEKVLIWKGLFAQDYVTVKSCLELNEIPVEVRNEMAATVLNLDGAATGGAHLWIYKDDYPRAVETLYDNGYLNELEYLEAKGITSSIDSDQRKNRRNISWIVVGVVVLALALVVAAIVFLG